jgi:hypothetical protein
MIILCDIDDKNLWFPEQLLSQLGQEFSLATQWIALCIFRLQNSHVKCFHFLG